MTPSDAGSSPALDRLRELIAMWRRRAELQRADGLGGAANKTDYYADELENVVRELVPVPPAPRLENYMPVEATLCPCPYCGEKAILTNVRESGHSFAIGCVNESCWRPRTDYYDTQKAVVDLWNSRVVPPAPSGAPNPEIEAFWQGVQRGWDIEPREYFEREAPKNGFKFPIAQALHHIWKRCVKENPPFLVAAPAPSAPQPEKENS